MNYQINPALNRAIRNKLKAIKDTQDAMLSGEIPVEMGTSMTCEECCAIERLLTELGNSNGNNDGLKGTIDRAKRPSTGQRIDMVLSGAKDEGEN